jgi:hypothetical protein
MLQSVLTDYKKPDLDHRGLGPAFCMGVGREGFHTVPPRLPRKEDCEGATPPLSPLQEELCGDCQAELRHDATCQS